MVYGHKKAKSAAHKRGKTLASKQKKRVAKAIKKTKLKKARKEKRAKASGADSAMDVTSDGAAGGGGGSGSGGDVMMPATAGVKMPGPKKKVTILNTAAMNRELTQQQRLMRS